MVLNQLWGYFAGPDTSVATPMRLQGMAAECGVVALAILMAHHGRDIPLDTMRRRISSPLAGSTLRQLRDAARGEGFATAARRVDLQGLKTVQLPAIVHLRFMHFAVLEAISGQTLRLNDPSEGVVEMSLSEFSRQFTGIVLTVTPSETEPEVGRGASSMPNTARRRFPITALLVACAITVTALALAAEHLLIAFAAMTVLIAADAIGMGHTRAAARMEVSSHNNQIQGHVAHWPAQDMVLAGRYRLDAMHAALEGLADPGARRWTQYAPGLAACLALPPLIAGYAGLLQSGILLVGSALLSGLSARRGKQRCAEDDLEADIGPMPADLFDPVARWRLGAGPQMKFAQLSGLSALMELPRFAAAERYLRLDLLFMTLVVASALPALFHATGGEAAAMLWCGLAGALLCVHATEVGEANRSRRLALARLSDIPPGDNTPSAHPDIGRRRGDRPLQATDSALEFRDVRWRPFETADDVFGPVSFDLPHGGLLAVEGRSGSGHSTLCRLCAGLLTPSSGDVIASAQPRGGAMGIVLVDGELPIPRGSVRSFLAMGGEREQRHALDMVELSGTLAARGGRELLLSSGAPELSGGQRARLHLARAILARPTLLVIDGILDSVEADLAERLLERLRGHGLTIVVSSLRSLPSSIASLRIRLDAMEDVV